MGLIFLSVALFLVWSAAMIFLGIAIGENDTRVIAVKRGYAKWVPNERGICTFKWKDEI